MDRQLLSRATDSSDAPTPGYMYLDIAKNAAGSPAACMDIAKYLAGRLQKNNPNIKYKCLKIISKTCASPYLKGGQFKRCLAQDPSSMAAIKEALQFRGPPDPVRGDQPYEKVRTAAKEALDAVYSDTPAADPVPFATSSSMAPSYGGNSGGGMSSAGGVGASGGRRMDGIGNPMFADPRLEPPPRNLANMTAVDVLNEAKETVIGMIMDPLAKNVQIQPRTSGGGAGAGGGYGGPPQSYGPPGRSELMHQTGGAWTMASNRGPSAVNPPPNFQNDSSYYKSRDSNNSFAWAQNTTSPATGVGGSWASAAPPATSQPSYNATPSISMTSTGPSVTSFIPPGGGGTASSDGSYEKQLIMELCPPGGMTAVPPPDKLNHFARSVSNLSPDLVCPALLDCLEEGQPWIIRAKALWVIETCMKHGQKPGETSNAYTDFFHACSGEIAPLVQHNRAQIRDPAKRVMALMGVMAPPALGAPPPPPVSPPAAAAPLTPMPNLLDFDEDSPSPAEPTTEPAPGMGEATTLFGGLNMAGSAAPMATAPVAPPPPPAAAPTSSTTENLLGDFLSVTETTALPALAGPDLFGDMIVKSAAPAAAPAPSQPAVPPPASSAGVVSSMFDNLSLKSGETLTAVPSLDSTLSTGSAFGFINQSSTSNATAAPVVAPPAAAVAATAPAASLASRDAFDPLKNVTPNSQKKMMQVSPEQMQAMMYQQMMMQQQQYMMAMQQQRMNPLQLMNVMRQQQQQQHPATQGRPVEDQKFNFVQDAMSMEKKK